MELMVNDAIFQVFGLKAGDFDCSLFSGGLINQTIYLKNKTSDADFVLQNINTNVFKKPETIANNIRLAADFLKEKCADYQFLNPVRTINGDEMYVTDGVYWRLTPFIHDTVALDRAENPKQAYEAAKQFGKLCRLLAGCNSADFGESIPGFHDLDFYFQQFKNNIKLASAERLEKAADSIKELLDKESIVTIYNELKNNPDFPTRIIHHDTKISNVLLNKDTFEGVCVIDLDTLMPGKIISDLGDMMRTYLSPVTEEETDFNKIELREDYYEALMMGYLSEMADEITATEKEFLVYSGKFIVYMQALRFLSDYLKNDCYYPVNRPEHNLDRAKNQIVLLNKLIEKESRLQNIIKNCLDSKAPILN
jgi:thiamine kinase-like enzyme